MTRSLDTVIDDALISIQNQMTLALFDKTGPAGFAFKVSRTKEGVSAEVTTQDRATTFCRFSVSTQLVTDTGPHHIGLKGRFTGTVAEDFPQAVTCFNAVNILMSVARMVDTTWCQSWRVDV